MRHRRISALVIWGLLLPALLWAANTTINRVPSTTGSGAATYNPDMTQFLTNEDANRQAELPLFPEGVVAQNGGGLHGVAASMTSPPFATTAYTSQGNRVTQASMSINYATQACPTNATAWVMASAQTTTPLGTFLRVPGSIYYTDCVSGPASPPPLPADSLMLMQVTLAGSQITAVADRAVRSVAGTSPVSGICLSATTVTLPPVGDIAIDATVGGVVVLGANSRRCQALITNNGGGDMRCAPSTLTVTSTIGYPVKAGQTLQLGIEGREAWRCIRMTGTTTAAAILEAIAP